MVGKNLTINPITWIITINYRTADLVIKSLDALVCQRAALGAGKVIVIDNASGDGSDVKLSNIIKTNGWSSWVNFIQADRNGGFAFGNNIGFTQALSSSDHVAYILLLNPDSLARPGAVEALVNFMDQHPNVGIAGSRLQNQDGDIVCSAHTFPSPLSELLEGASLSFLSKCFSAYEVTPPLRNEAHRCDWVSGSSMIIRRKVIEDIGMMDEGFFLYFEEVDFFKRAAAAGWQTWYVPESVVMHIEGASTDIKSTKRRPAYWYNSRRRYFVKHYGILGLISADICLSIGRLSFWFRRLLRLGAQGDLQDPKWFMFDLLWSDLRAILTGEILRI